LSNHRILTIATVLLFCSAPAWAQTMTMPDGTKMDMKGMAPAKTPAAKKAQLQSAKPIAKPKTGAAPAMGGMSMPMENAPSNARAAKPMNGMTMPMDNPPAKASASKAGAGDMGGMTMPANGAGTPSGSMPGMDMGHMKHDMAMHGLLGGYAMSREASGTSWQPDAAPHSGIHLMADDWMVMLHGRINGIADWQSGPRGGDQVFSSSMAMVMANKDLANGDTLGLKAMISGDPFMGRRGYPLLLASGETGDGATHLIDRQHPHDLLMELAASYSHPLSDNDSLFLYGGYPGEPALGPSAYMHRVSASDNPMTPIAHHWLDATHVSFGVVTAGWVHEGWKVEASRFTGREPDQFRFDFDTARFDSTSVRLSYNPDPHWSLQVSSGWLKSPEQLDPDVNEQRLTASATWFNQFDWGSVAATVAFGRKQLSSGISENAVLAEMEYKPAPPWTLFARAESIGSTELVPVAAGSGPVVRGAGEFSLGAIHDWPIFNQDGADHWKIGLGGLYAFDFAPSSAVAGYGANPHGAMGFVRLVAE
jgi:hypothetical protein